MKSARPATEASAGPPPAARAGAVAKTLVLLLLFVAGAGIFLPSLSFEFLSWDDDTYILRNLWIRGFSTENFRAIFFKPYFHNYLPFHLLSYQVDYALWGPKAFGFHLHSLLLHGLNVVLACLTLAKLGSPWPVAALASLLFAVHPSHVESVAWISSRKDLLSLTFALLATCAYHASREEGRPARRYYLISLTCYGIAIMSKMIVVLLPFFFILADRLDPRTKDNSADAGSWAALRGKIPFFVGGALLSVVNYRVQAKEPGPALGHAFEHLLVRGYAVWKYFLVLCGVAPGRPAYDLPDFGPGRGEALAALGGLILAGLAAAALAAAWRRRLGAALLGTGWLVLMLLPALAFPLVTFMADRYLYAASLGFAWLLAAAAYAAAARLKTGGLRLLVPGGVIILCAAGFGLRTLQYLPAWRNSETLWSSVIAVSRSRTARNALAVIRMDQQRFDEAESLLREAAFPRDAMTHRMFGILFYKKQAFPEAIRENEKGIALCREPPGCLPELLGSLYFNNGVAYWRMRDFRASAQAYEQAFRANPDNLEARDSAAKARRLVR